MGIRGPLMVVLGTVFASILAACGGEDGGPGGGPVRVVATYSILGDLVRNVGGEEVEVTTLVGPDGDAHTFEPAPSDNAELAGADVVFENGLGFETWLDDLYGSSGSEAERVVVTGGIKTIPIAGEEHGREKGPGEHTEGEGEHGEKDPHVWHDPTKAIRMVESIREALVGADPENADAYRQNAGEYISELRALDEYARGRVKTIPEENRILFTSHDTFRYFADHYGFEVDTALASASTEAGDPSAGETAELVGKIEASGVPAIFAENVSDSSVMENIASEAGVELAPALYTDALGGPASDGATYEQMMRYNVSTMAEALQQ